MNRKVIGIIMAVLLAAVGTFGIVRYVQAADERALAGQESVDVLVVQEAVAKGTPAEALRDRVATEKVPAKVRADDAITDLSKLEGKVALVDLVPGEQVVAARFGTQEVLALQSGVEVPDGLHQVTIKLAPERAVGGQLRAGDLVAVTATFDPFLANGADGNDTPNSSHILLHKVLVTNVVSDSAPAQAEDEEEGTQTRSSRPEGQAYYVTLALDAPSVERVVFAAEEGRVWLSMEPEDAPEDGTRIQTRNDIYGGNQAG